MKAKVLIIEDDEEIIESIRLGFKYYWTDAKIVYSNTGNGGIEMIRTESPDIILLDLGLPDISGFDVLQKIRMSSSIPILILTVRSNEDDVVRALENEADDYIIKPFRLRELIARLQSQLNQWMTSQIKAAIR